MFEHDEAACARRMSRRFFFQAAAGAAVVIAAGPEIAEWTVHTEIGHTFYTRKPYFLTPEMISAQVLSILSNNFKMAEVYSREFEAEFNADRAFLSGDQWPSEKIGDTIQFRKPARYLA